LLADGGLGDAVDLGGLGETFRFGQVAEHFQALNLHKLIKQKFTYSSTPGFAPEPASPWPAIPRS
jgi:hypothetical protein